MKKAAVISAAAAMGMLLFILDASACTVLALDGISVCLRVIIPGLFPFFFLTNLLSTSLPYICRPGKLYRFCGIPKGCESIYLLGLLGGYPVGAQCIGDSYQKGSLTKQDAKRLLGFCCNAGPAFIFGVTGAVFSSRSWPWLLWAIHVISSLLTGIFLPEKNWDSSGINQKHKTDLPEALKRSVQAIGYVCGWVVLFRIVCGMLRRWVLWYLPETFQILITGILELSNGVLALQKIPSEPLRFILCSGMLAFGGLCVALQAVTAVGSIGSGYYFPGKVLQTFLSIFLASVVQVFLNPGTVSFWIPAAAVIFTGIFLIWIRKSSSIHAEIGV